MRCLLRARISAISKGASSPTTNRSLDGARLGTIADVKKQAGGLGFEPRLADPESAVLPFRRSPSEYVNPLFESLEFPPEGGFFFFRPYSTTPHRFWQGKALRVGYSAELSVALGRLWESGLPGTLKAVTMQLAQASQHDLGIVLLPASTWRPHAMMDHVVGRAFHRPTAYGVACLTEVVIAHPRLIGLEIPRGLTHLWPSLDQRPRAPSATGAHWHDTSLSPVPPRGSWYR
jgi:hypothetical protein